MMRNDAVDTVRDGGAVLCVVHGGNWPGAWWVHSTRDEGRMQHSPLMRTADAASRYMRGGTVTDDDVIPG